MNITVVICTHNPREEYLRAALEGLNRQTLSLAQWEFILIDNKSSPALAARFDVGGLPSARIVREEELGVMAARHRALREARGDVIVFVDDDNVLDPDYLAHVAQFDREWPMFGAWGCGELRGVFETPPPEWMIPHMWYLTVHKVTVDHWSNRADMPCFAPGAGLAVRRAAVRPYFDAISEDGLRRSMDRRGDNLSSAGDIDMLWMMTENGWGVGRFVRLKLNHLISARRLEEAYFERMVANQWCSNVILKYFHGIREAEPPVTWRAQFSHWRYERSLSTRDRWLAAAQRRGRAHAARIIAELERGNRDVRQELR